MNPADLAYLLRSRLTLTRPLVIFDLETTGMNPREDRIVEMAFVKIHVEAGATSWATLVAPGVGIPAEATAVHGITDADVAAAPGFRELAPGLARALTGCDVGGYNALRFDVPLLAAEFARSGVASPLEDCAVVDPYQVWCKQESRDLAVACTRWGVERSGREHRAMSDAWDAAAVLAAQLASGEMPRTAGEIERWTRPREWLDRDGRLRWSSGRVVFGFGKHEGQGLGEVPRDYLTWMLSEGFSAEVKLVVRRVLAGEPVERAA